MIFEVKTMLQALIYILALERWICYCCAIDNYWVIINSIMCATKSDTLFGELFWWPTDNFFGIKLFKKSREIQLKLFYIFWLSNNNLQIFKVEDIQYPTLPLFALNGHPQSTKCFKSHCLLQKTLHHS